VNGGHSVAELSFWGGVGVIGSSKILVEQDGWRVLLDLGLDFTPEVDVFRGRVAPRTGRALEDRIRTRHAPPIPRLYRPEAVSGTEVPGGSDGRTIVCLTHAHPDHAGLAGWVDPGVPIYASHETRQILQALDACSLGGESALPPISAVAEGEPLRFGPFVIRRYDVDHDVPGSSGYLVETDDGMVAYTGDLRLHGRAPHRTLSFARAAHRARALVIEGTALSLGTRHSEPSERELDERFAALCQNTPGLIVLGLHYLNLERVQSFSAIAKSCGRTILWPSKQRDFLHHMGLFEAQGWDEIPIDEIRRQPKQYAVQVTVPDLPIMLDLPLGPGAVYIHSNGEPFGAYDPEWALLADWLSFTHTPLFSLSTSGHAAFHDVHLLVEQIQPDIVFPIHTAAPENLVPPPGTRRWIPERGGRVYSLHPES
jgi:ribonuclease J